MNSSLHIGFTGTRTGMTAAQRRACKATLHHLKAIGANTLHHGDCIGADAHAHNIALAEGYEIYLHPSSDNSQRASCRKAKITFSPLPPLERNRKIVNATGILIAAPRVAFEELRSGTWATIRYARKLDRLVFLINPDGFVKTLGGAYS